MPTPRQKRLQKLVLVMQRLKDFHQAQHAAHMAEAAAARDEARTITETLDSGTAMTALFPELYHRRVASALERSRTSADRARQEAQSIMQADARSNALARAYREAADLEERSAADKERLEFIERRRTNGA
ncbi:hypothetical protein A33O_10873 [Nitratireductor aquibiodomus RA22]|uniref:Flagellar FliJ protein n=2 Tax=Nitratireductor aquibiodomus TaxID=204799 RepID=A0A1H4JI96_9HYPH|nr:hypothetical protein [Nitratireductor aquibiodomus]EIM74668.1 hypothetical protein A33O_10873 [Nitratireductor aquibiodomus RA22]SEB45755.1 hypothetical protein SAMN05216452_1386 [Nitratireductor aquibiodomus]